LKRVFGFDTDFDAVVETLRKPSTGLKPSWS